MPSSDVDRHLRALQTRTLRDLRAVDLLLDHIDPEEEDRAEGERLRAEIEIFRQCVIDQISMRRLCIVTPVSSRPS